MDLFLRMQNRAGKRQSRHRRNRRHHVLLWNISKSAWALPGRTRCSVQQSIVGASNKLLMGYFIDLLSVSPSCCQEQLSDIYNMQQYHWVNLSMKYLQRTGWSSGVKVHVTRQQFCRYRNWVLVCVSKCIQSSWNVVWSFKTWSGMWCLEEPSFLLYYSWELYSVFKVCLAIYAF